jgi:WD40 repeat protein
MASAPDQPDRELDASGEQQPTVEKRGVIILALIAVAALAFIVIGPPEPVPEDDLVPPEQETLFSPIGAVHAVAIAQLDGRPVVVSGSGDGTVRVWDLATRAPIGGPLTGHTGPMATAQLDGRPVVVLGSDHRTLRVWDLATGAPIGQPLTGHTIAVHAVAIAQLDGRPVVVSGDGGCDYSRCYNGVVRVWDLATGTLIGQPLTGHTDAVNAVAIAQLDGRSMIVSGGSLGTIDVWDLATDTLIGQSLNRPRRDDRVNALAIAQLDSRPVVVAGGTFGMVRVWDLATGALILRPHWGPHVPEVEAVATAQLDGRPVVVSIDSGSDVDPGWVAGARVWDLATGAPIGQPLSGHTDAPDALAIAQLDGRPVIVSGSWDGMRVWDLATGAPIGQPFPG